MRRAITTTAAAAAFLAAAAPAAAQSELADAPFCPPELSARPPHRPLSHTVFGEYRRTGFLPTEARRWPYYSNPLLPHRVHPWKEHSYVQRWGTWSSPYVTKLDDRVLGHRPRLVRLPEKLRTPTR